MTLTDTRRSRATEPKIGPRTVRAHPRQTIPDEPLGGSVWKWGDEWKIGRRRGRWLIKVSKYSGEATLIRVEWDRFSPLHGPWGFVWNASNVQHHAPDDVLEDALSAAMQAAQAFDAMALELWGRRDAR